MTQVPKSSVAGLVFTLLLLPVFGWQAAQVEFGTPVVEDWLPADSPALRAYETFRSRFGDDQFLLVTGRDISWDSPKLKQLAIALRSVAQTRRELGIQSVVSSADLVAQVENPRAGISQSAALRRLRGVGVGKKGEGFITVRINGDAAAYYGQLVQVVTRTAADVAGLQGSQLILAGEPLQVAIIDKSSRDTIQRFVAPSSIGALAVAWLCLRSLRLTMIVFAFGGVAQLVGLALIASTLGSMSAVIVVLPTLIFMLTLSAAIHLTSYYVASGSTSVHDAGQRAIRLGWQPCCLATVTTAFGFSSLIVSGLSPVWQFGSLAAGGLLIATGLLLSAYAAAVDMRFPTGRTNAAKRTELDASNGERIAVASSPRSPAVVMTAVCSRFSIPLTLLSLALLLVAAVGVGRLTTSTEFEDMFSSNSSAVASLQWCREHIGEIDKLEIVVRIPEIATQESGDGNGGNPLRGRNAEQGDAIQHLSVVQDLHRRLAALPEVGAVTSALTFMPQLPQSSSLRSVVRRAVVRKRLEASYDALQAGRLLAVDSKAKYWRVTVEVLGLTNSNYLDIHNKIHETCQQQTDARGPKANLSFEITGLRTVIETAHRSLLADLGWSFLTAFALILPVMMLIMRSPTAGVILMIPNLIPVGIVFGTMGWLGIRLDVASILTASVALGIAVDDTLHFIHWYAGCRRKGVERSDAVESAMRACARPMLNTTFICTASMLPFLFSEFLPTSKFALLMILMLLGAIIGDLIMLPAILLSPLGKFIGQTKTSSKSSV
ncbi:MAG TPA: hypothetical protein DDW52_20615 [Planctomycetaceae bacterium]|nr:hypothetical protein [Planctomycetaceae bacterium]